MIGETCLKLSAAWRFSCLSGALPRRIPGRLVLGVRHQTSLAATSSTRNGDDSNRPFAEIPGPPGVPLFGNLLGYVLTRKQPFDVEQDLFAKYGAIYKEKMFGKDIVHVSDLDAVSKVLRSEGKYPNRPAIQALVDLRQEREECVGVAQMQGAEWHRLRQAVAPKMLRLRDLHANVPGFNDVANDVMGRLASVMGTHGHEGEVPDLDGEVFKWSTESIGTFVFGDRLGLFRDPPPEDVLAFIQAVNDFFTYTQKVEFGPEKLLRTFKMDTPSMRKLREVIDVTTNVGMKYVKEQMERLDARENSPEEVQAVPLLTYLLTRESLTPNEAAITAMEMLAGGVDTTGTTMRWILYLLATNPEAQDRLREEVDDVFGSDGQFTDKQLNKIPYLKSCLKETMRLTPVSTANVRILPQDTEILGYHVPAETMIQLSTYSIGRSEKYFKDPLAFRPDRWLRETQGDDAASREFFKLPFGFGPRMCIGRRVAELEIYVLLAKIIQRYRLEYHHEPVEPVLRLVSCPDRPVRIKFVERE